MARGVLWQVGKHKETRRGEGKEEEEKEEEGGRGGKRGRRGKEGNGGGKRRKG